MKTFFDESEGTISRPLLARVARHVVLDPESAEDDDKVVWTDARYCSGPTGDVVDQIAGWDKKF